MSMYNTRGWYLCVGKGGGGGGGGGESWTYDTLFVFIRLVASDTTLGREGESIEMQGKKREWKEGEGREGRKRRRRGKEGEGREGRKRRRRGKETEHH